MALLLRLRCVFCPIGLKRVSSSSWIYMFWRSTVYFWCCKEKGYLREVFLVALSTMPKKSISSYSAIASQSKQALSSHLNSKLNYDHEWHLPGLYSRLPFFLLWGHFQCGSQVQTPYKGDTSGLCWLSLLLSTFPKCWGTNVSIKVPLISLNPRKNTLRVLQVHTWFHKKKLSENESLRHWRGDMSNRQRKWLCIFLFNIIPLIKDPGSRTNYAVLKWGGGILYSQ